ncbi:hypothetical protein TREMEDRAFT_61397 [Tremella mesenterica DSM 1558]|uniref:uncharacterized protein n=1 Tax=Tremella mesenterica (strain ATCC 24925 / CBS 8224 / DSM 1558 / NBRC 9311 / NRRL Y-6157 / RJB 2259-6 / UBC 559-6) TaxID=578456 RepID=UPI0003F4963A|nr:uncharacterized protein TREMEDRAFT_61397 [Tremella mesenterica DSM 1558]EIW70884.1 hypothetical protein TREMEDRAFT_61397 [Tremella mesenterica DSM 1558]
MTLHLPDTGLENLVKVGLGARDPITGNPYGATGSSSRTPSPASSIALTRSNSSRNSQVPGFPTSSVRQPRSSRDERQQNRGRSKKIVPPEEITNTDPTSSGPVAYSDGARHEPAPAHTESDT